MVLPLVQLLVDVLTPEQVGQQHEQATDEEQDVDSKAPVVQTALVQQVSAIHGQGSNDTAQLGGDDVVDEFVVHDGSPFIVDCRDCLGSYSQTALLLVCAFRLGDSARFF